MEITESQPIDDISPIEGATNALPKPDNYIPSRRQVIKNAFFNTISIGAPALTALVMTPFLISALGKSTYGLWLLIAAVLSWFTLVDIGVRTAACRYFSLHRAEDDAAAINSTFTTSIIILSIGSLLIAIATVIGTMVMPLMIEVPPDQIVELRMAMLIAGLGLALTYPQRILEALLFGWQWFGILSSLEIFTLLVQTGFVVLLVLQGHGLVGIAVACFISGVFSAGIKWASIRKLMPQVQFVWSQTSYQKTQELFLFGGWNILRHMSKTALSSVALFIVGIAISTASVTVYGVAGKLVEYITLAMVAIFGVLVPISTTLHAQQDQGREEKFFLSGSRYCWLLSIYLVGGLLLFAQPFIRLWLGNEMLDAYRIVAILAVGSIVPLSQIMTDNVLVAKSRHQLLAILMLVTAVVALVASWFVVDQFGLTGIATIVASAATIAAIFECRMGCSILGVAKITYTMKAIVPVLLISAVPLGFTAFVRNWWTPASWPYLILGVAGYTGLFLLAYSFSMIKSLRVSDCAMRPSHGPS
ncbi:MAG: oligosaccharide flippase family protein [Pirellulales bacterium]